MSDLLDLRITLTPPPADRPDAIAAIALSCGAPLNLDHAGDLLPDPLTPAERDDLRWYLEEYWQWPYEQFIARAHKVERLLDDLGARLYNAVFGSIGARELLQAWRQAEEQQRQISIISSIPAALSLPWELLHDAQGFLALRTRAPVSILRRLPQSESAGFATTFTPPLRVLLVTARPDDAGFIDPRGIARELLDEVQAREGAGAIALEFLRPPTLAALRERLSDAKQPPVHVLHFDGHGVFKPDDADARPADDGIRLRGGGQGMLAFENDQGKLDLVRAETLAQVLQDSGVRLAVLTACQSAMSAADDAFSSVAGRLIKGGVDAVVAMSASLLVASATRYVEAFYRRLAEGMAVPVAHERARQALHDDRRRHVHRRRADDEGAPVELSDWWLPHFYQQRPLTLQPEDGERRTKNKEQRTESRRRKTKGQQVTTDDGQATRLSEEMPGPPRYEFQGRARELQRIERQSDDQNLIRQRGAMLSDLGDVLQAQGKYKEARAAYEDALKVFQQIGDVRSQAADISQLGLLALDQRDYAEAHRRYAEALDLFRALNEPATEAIVWHQLGRVAEEQKAWAEAERCYRTSLAINEQLGDTVGAARTCNQLARVAQLAGRPTEAEGWYKKAIVIAEGLKDDKTMAIRLNNLANLLLNETRAGRGERLAEARGYAEQALAIHETLDVSSGIWETCYNLAGIADLEGRADAARDYSRRERATFAAFAGNR